MDYTKQDIHYYEFAVGREGWKQPDELEWNVFLYEFNGKLIVYNVIYGIYDNLIKMVKKYKKLKAKVIKEASSLYPHDTEKRNKQLIKWDENYKMSTFMEDLRIGLQSKYWSRCEYEMVVTSWPPYIKAEEVSRLCKEKVVYRTSVDLDSGYKVDIYQQVMLNFHCLLDYVWNNKYKIKEKKNVK